MPRRSSRRGRPQSRRPARARRQTPAATLPTSVSQEERPMLPAQPRPTITGTSEGIAVLSLILNILIFPGLGTLIAGRISGGLWQIILTIIAGGLVVIGAITLMFGIIIAGIALGAIVWIWALISGIRIIQRSHR